MDAGVAGNQNAQFRHHGMSHRWPLRSLCLLATSEDCSIEPPSLLAIVRSSTPVAGTCADCGADCSNARNNRADEADVSAVGCISRVLSAPVHLGQHVHR